MFVAEFLAVSVEGVIENVRIETAYSTQEVNNFQADLAIDGSNDTCFKTTTGSATSLLLTLDRRRTVVGVSMWVHGRMSRVLFYLQFIPLVELTLHTINTRVYTSFMLEAKVSNS